MHGDDSNAAASSSDGGCVRRDPWIPAARRRLKSRDQHRPVDTARKILWLRRSEASGIFRRSQAGDLYIIPPVNHLLKDKVA